MALAQCKWTYDANVNGVKTKENGELQSAVFPAYLPSGKKIALPTLEELVTPGNKKYDSALKYSEGARKIITGQIGSVVAGIATTDANDKQVISTTNIVTLPKSEQYYVEYHYFGSDATGKTTYEITYTYTFAAVENKLPMKPWTILSVVERILDLAHPIYSEGANSTVAHPRFIVDPDQRDWLEYADDKKKVLRLSPEFTMTRCTLREQLKIVGSYIHAEPRLIHKTVDGKDRYCIHFDPYGETVQSPAKAYPYVYCKRTQHINQYCTSIDSMTDNMVNSAKNGRGTVVNPWRGGGISTRCASEHVRVTDTNGLAPTNFPVQRISRVLAGAWNRDENRWAVGMLDITSYVVEATAYNANLSSYGGVYPYSKSYAIYYTMGQKNLQGLFFREPTASQVSMKCWAIVNILAAVSDWDADNLQKVMEKHPCDFVFQIDYDPIYSSHIAHGKQDIDPSAVDYAQISNQSENLIEVSYYGENLKGIAARMGEVDEIRTGFLQKFDDLPKVGQMIDNMAISSVSFEVRPNGIKYTMSLTKNFNRISQFIGVNSHKRLYEVSERQAYERHILLREYGVFKIFNKFAGTQGVFGQQSIYDVVQAFVPNETTNAARRQADHVFARLLSKDKQEAYQLVQLPVVASPMGNVASYSWRYADNYSAGPEVDVRSEGAYQKEVPYCDYYGRGWWYDFAVQQYKGENPDDLNIYPATDGVKCWQSWDNAKSGALISTDNCGSLLLRKDSREALSFTAQLEFKSATPGLIIGSGLAQRLPSIAGLGSGRARIYFLPNPINKFEVRKLMDSNVPSIKVTVNAYFGYAMISTPESIPVSADGYKAWVIAVPPKNGNEVTYQNDDGTVFKNTDVVGGEVLLARNMNITGGANFPSIYFTLVKDIFKQ